MIHTNKCKGGLRHTPPYHSAQAGRAPLVKMISLPARRSSSACSDSRVASQAACVAHTPWVLSLPQQHSTRCPCLQVQLATDSVLRVAHVRVQQVRVERLTVRGGHSVRVRKRRWRTRARRSGGATEHHVHLRAHRACRPAAGSPCGRAAHLAVLVAHERLLRLCREAGLHPGSARKGGVSRTAGAEACSRLGKWTGATHRARLARAALRRRAPVSI